MNYNKVIILLVIGVLSIGLVSAICGVKYFYRDDCPFCQNVKPDIQNAVETYPNVEWTFYDMNDPVNSGELSKYARGVPTLVVDDTIILTGAVDIPRWMPCYLQKMSTKECPTLSADHSTNDWFIRE